MTRMNRIDWVQIGTKKSRQATAKRNGAPTGFSAMFLFYFPS